MEKENKKEKASKKLEDTARTMADAMLAIIDKLAGKESDIKLCFEDLTLDMGMFKTTLNGAIVLDIVYPKDTKA